MSAYIANVPATPSSYRQNDWADKTIVLVEEKGGAAGGQILYAASKALAERAIIDFVKKHKGEIEWDETRILPVWVREVFHSQTTNLTQRSRSLVYVSSSCLRYFDV